MSLIKRPRQRRRKVMAAIYRGGCQRGAVALEFLVLFPLIFSLIYVAGVYGVLFSWQVRMQIAVDRATASVMHLDRSSASDPSDAALELARRSLIGGDSGQGMAPEFMGTLSGNACYPDGSGADRKIACTLKITLKDGGCEGGLGATGTAKSPGELGFFGGFPPLPNCLKATAKVAF